MRQVHRKLGQAGKGVLQTREHGVEGRREGGQLRGPADGADPRMELGGSNALRGVGNLGEGAHASTGDDDTRTSRNDHPHTEHQSQGTTIRSEERFVP